jgi:cell division protein FtsB
MKRLAVLAGLVVLAFFLFSLAGLAVQGYSLGQRSDAVQTDLAKLKAENERLKGEVGRLQTDPALEGLARAQLGYVKEGETAVVVDFGPGGPPKPNPTPTPTPLPNRRRWLDAVAR